VLQLRADGALVIRYQTLNSVYEVDEKEGQIRRVSGVADPTQRMGVDGVWQPFKGVTETDGVLVIVWPWLNDDGSTPLTITSKVTKVTWRGHE
jgi:hypothetical protein